MEIKIQKEEKTGEEYFFYDGIVGENRSRMEAEGASQVGGRGSKRLRRLLNRLRRVTAGASEKLASNDH